MFKVMIVDDEQLSRKGLRNSVNWKKFDCEVCAEASNGLEGFEIIRKLRPDIIFTGIRMPEVDGISMIRMTRNLVPESKIIILSGHRDFDHVRDAIKLGAFDFLLKPTPAEEVTSIVGRATRELKHHRSKDEEIRKLTSILEQNIPILRERFLYDVLYGMNTSEEDILAKAELLKSGIKKFQLVVIENETAGEQEGDEHEYIDLQLHQLGLINTFLRIFSGNTEITGISLNHNRMAFIVGTDNDDVNRDQCMKEKCTQLQQMVKGSFGFSISVAVSSEGSGILELSMKFRECREALEQKLYMGGILNTEEISNNTALNDTRKMNGPNHKSIKLVLRKAIDYLQSHYQEQVTLNDVAESLYVSTFYISKMFKKELNKNFVDYLNEIRVEKACELLKDLRFRTYEIARLVGIPDPHYFSKMFKKYAGMTPTEFRDS